MFSADTNEVHAVGEAGSVDADDGFVGIEGIQEFAVNVVNFNALNVEVFNVAGDNACGWVREQVYVDAEKILNSWSRSSKFDDFAVVTIETVDTMCNNHYFIF